MDGGEQPTTPPTSDDEPDIPIQPPSDDAVGGQQPTTPPTSDDEPDWWAEPVVKPDPVSICFYYYYKRFAEGWD